MGVNTEILLTLNPDRINMMLLTGEKKGDMVRSWRNSNGVLFDKEIPLKLIAQALSIIYNTMNFV